MTHVAAESSTPCTNNTGPADADGAAIAVEGEDLPNDAPTSTLAVPSSIAFDAGACVDRFTKFVEFLRRTRL